MSAHGAEGPAPGAEPALASATAPERARARAKIIASFRGLLVAIGLWPWALPFLRAWLPLGNVGVALDYVFFAMCHRRPARTLIFEGVAMPLCSRCAGIFLGVALGAALGRPIIAVRAWRWAFAVACALMVTDVLTQDLGLHPVWHATRVATGVLVGYLMVIGTLSALATDRV